MHSGVVEASEVATGSPATNWFRDNVKWRCPRGIGVPNYAHFFHLGKLRFGNLQLFLFEATSASMERWAISGDVVLQAMLVGICGLESGNEELEKFVND